MSAGLENLVDLVGKAGANHDRYYISGARKKLGVATRKLLGVSALSTVPIEGFIFECFKDDRLLERSARLWVDAQAALDKEWRS